MNFDQQKLVSLLAVLAVFYALYVMKPSDGSDDDVNKGLLKQPTRYYAIESMLIFLVYTSVVKP